MYSTKRLKDEHLGRERDMMTLYEDYYCSFFLFASNTCAKVSIPSSWFMELIAVLLRLAIEKAKCPWLASESPWRQEVEEQGVNPWVH